MRIFITFLLIFSFLFIFSQDKSQREKIIASYDLIKIESYSKYLNAKYIKEKNFALKMAKLNNWPLIKSINGNFMELQRITSEGKPLYYQTLNKDAAISTRANFLYQNGTLGLNIEGQGMSAFVWDGGSTLLSHQEFMDNGTSKVISADNSNMPISDHATHVLGTMISKGINLNSKGMAPQANGYALDWNNDAAEVTSATGFGMLISNHSYGPNIADLSTWSIGAYTSESEVWDNIMYNAPYYLLVCAGGNDGNYSNNNPLENNSGFDKLYGKTTSKNTMVVANANDAIVSANGDIIGSGIITSGSSQGPTDDYRIKPDITGNGTNLLSPIGTTNTSYDSYTGTSMASPNVAGSLLLLQQLYNQENNNFMLAATLKGLALHTADDKGIYGPDTKYGWGYMNTKRAAEVILSSNEILEEFTLLNNQSISFAIQTTGNENLLASISWTDPPGTNINSGVLNSTTPVLINDLDIRITKGNTEYLPWKLNGVYSVTKDDNNVDPFENVEVFNPGNDTYIITISHKGNLFNATQNFSLIVTGISSSTMGLLDSEETIDFNIYPNPTTNGIVNIAINNTLNTKLIVYNILGEIVDTKTLSANNKIHQLDYSRFQAGVYLISLSNNNSKTTKKLIIK